MNAGSSLNRAKSRWGCEFLPVPPPHPQPLLRLEENPVISCVSKDFFFNIWERRQKKIHYRFFSCFICATTSNGCSVIVLLTWDEARMRTSNYFCCCCCFFSLCHNPETVTPLQCSCGLHSSWKWKIWQPEFFFFCCLKPPSVISYCSI